MDLTKFIRVLSDQLTVGLKQAAEKQIEMRQLACSQLEMSREDYVKHFISKTEIEEFVSRNPFLRSKRTDEIIDLLYTIDMQKLRETSNITVMSDAVNLNFDFKVDINEEDKEQKICLSNKTNQKTDNNLKLELSLSIRG